jgi:Uma2 family endonuclease
MPQAVDKAPAAYESPPSRKRWTRSECDFLRDNGLLAGRYELIDGEVISKMGQNRPHVTAVMLLVAWLMAVFGNDRVQCQGSIDIGASDDETNEPEPDAVALAAPLPTYAHNPGPADLLLVVEISDTTLRFDRTAKAALYARAGICEYWIVDLVGNRILAHRAPAPEGYAEVVEYGSEETIATIAHPDASVRVSDLLPPAC